MALSSKEVKLILNAQDNTHLAFKRVEQNMSKLGGVARTLTKTLGTIGLGIGVAGITRDLFAVNVEFDKLQASLVTVTGSEAAAETAFKNIQKFASETPYQINEVTSAFIKMKSLGMDASEGALRSYGNTASAMGKDLNQMIEAVADASTGEFERLKEFGIKARSQGDNVSLTFRGITTTIGKNSKEIQDYLRKIGDVDFAGGMSRQMDTLGGSMSNLGDNWSKMLRAFGESGGADTAASAINSLSSSLERLGDAVLTFKQMQSSGAMTFWEWLTTDSTELADRNVEEKSMARARKEIQSLESELAMGGSNPKRAQEIKRDLQYWREGIQELEVLLKTKKELSNIITHTASAPNVVGGDGGEKSTKTPLTTKEIAAFATSAKGITDSWEQMFRDRYEVQSRSMDVQIAMEAEAARLSTIPWDATKDFWQMQADERFEVISRGIDAQIDLEKSGMTKLDAAAKELGMSFSSAFEDAIVKGEGLREVMQGLLQDILRIVIRKSITEPLAGAISTGISGLFPSADGNVFSQRGLVPFANGGVVNRPTIFPFANGTGLMGEAGPEAIMPLTRIGGKLGVKSTGSGASVNINQSFDLRGSDESTLPKLTQWASQIEQKTLASVRQSLSRGGDLHRLTRG